MGLIPKETLDSIRVALKDLDNINKQLDRIATALEKQNDELLLVDSNVFVKHKEEG